MTRWICALFGMLACTSALLAQPVQQSGNVTPTHLACWTTNGVLQDCGTGASNFPTTGGVTPGPWCVNSGPNTGAYQSFCLQASAAGGQLSIQNFAGAAAGGISFLINGVAAGLATVNLPTVSGDIACFNSTSGSLVDCGFATLPLIVGTTQITSGTSTRVLYDNAGTLGEYTNAQLTALCNQFTSLLLGCVPASGGGTTNFLRADGTFAAPPNTPPGGSSGQVQTNNGSGGFAGITNTQLTALINSATASLSGALPAWPNTTTTFFRGDGSYQTLNFAAISGTLGSGQFGPLTGDVTTSGYAATIAANAVTNAKAAQGAAGAVKCNPTSVLANFQDCAAAAIGIALLKPAPGQASGATNAWIAIDPYGNNISTASTQCQGLDKFWTAVDSAHWGWAVVAGDSTGAISCNTPIKSPTCFSRGGYIDPAVVVSFTAQGSSTLVTIDSFENCRQQFYGQFAQNAADTGIVVAVKPTNADQIGNTVGDASILEFASVSAAPGGLGIVLDATNGEILGNRQIDFGDVNTGLVAIRLTNPTHGIAENKYSCSYTHSQTTAVIQEGTSTTNQANMKGSSWIGCERLAGTAPAIVWDIFAVGSTYVGFNISGDGGLSATGIKLESGACNLTFVGGSVEATTALSDSSACAAGSTNSFIGVKGISPQLAGTGTNDNASSGSVGQFLSVNCTPSSSTITVTIASPAVVTWTAHPFLNSATEIDTCPVKFTNSGGALPTGITAGTTYWVIPSSVTTNTFKIATTIANALAGTAVNTSGSQSGTQTASELVSDFVANPSTNNVVGISLPAGDWDCRGNATDNPGGSTIVTAVTVALGTTSTTLPNDPAGGSYSAQNYSGTGTARVLLVGTARFNVAGTTTIYMLFNSAFTVSTQGVLAAFMGCRRMR